MRSRPKPNAVCHSCGKAIRAANFELDVHFCANSKCNEARRRYRNPPLPCANCGELTQAYRPNKTGKAFCNKEECKVARNREHNKIHQRKVYAKVKEERDTFNAFGEAVVRDPFKRIVKPKKGWPSGKQKDDPSDLSCTWCRWNPHCRERVRVGLWVACETADERDKEFVRVSENGDKIVELLREAMTY